MEKRAFERIPFNFSLKILNLQTSDTNLAETTDMSAMGLGILSERKLFPQTALDIWVKIPTQSEPFYVRGEVAWCQKFSFDKYKAGINFRKPQLLGVARALRAAGKI
jgi:hypothetical protein